MKEIVCDTTGFFKTAYHDGRYVFYLFIYHLRMEVVAAVHYQYTF